MMSIERNTFCKLAIASFISHISKSLITLKDFTYATLYQLPDYHSGRKFINKEY